MNTLLTDQKITQQVFSFLDENTIRGLIPLAGERLLFNIKFKAEIQNAEIENVKIKNAEVNVIDILYK